MKHEKNTLHESAIGHASGSSAFIDDFLPLSDEVFVGIIGAPIAKGKLLKIHSEEALKTSGVFGIYSAKDLVKNRWGNINKDQPLLVEEQIEYHQEPILVVACKNREIFWEVKRKIHFEIQEEKPLLDPEEAFAQKQILYQGKHFKQGDFDLAFNNSENKLSGKLYIGGQEHFYLENHTAIVIPKEHLFEVWSSTQCPTETQHVVADILGVPYHHVVCSVRRLGGGFGGKETQANPLAALAALCAKQLKRSARLVLTKDEDMQITGKRHPFVIKYQVGFSNEGVITALKLFFIADGGAYTDLSPAILDRAHYHADGAYFIENIDIQGVAVKTNHHSNTAMRGFGAPQAYLAIENIIEEISFQLKKDPVDVRLKNLYGKSERNKTPYGQIFTNNVLPDLIQKLLITSDYKKRRAALKSDKHKLRGISLTTCKFGISFTNRILNQASSLVNLHLDGTVQVSTGVVEMGQGVFTKLQQIVAFELGIPTQNVQVMATSTEKNHNTAPTAASTGADLNGSATFKAVRKIKFRLATLALNYWQTGKFEEIDWNDNRYSEALHFEDILGQVLFSENKVTLIAQPSQTISLTTLIAQAFQCHISLGELAFYKTPLEPNSPFYYYTQGASVSEVEIDLLTGHVRIPRVDILMDLGQSLNPGIDRGQISGAFVQSLGWMLLESLTYSDKGELTSHAPSTYKIPTACEIPEVWNIDLFENTLNLKNLYGSKAAGEPPYLMSFSVWTAIKELVLKSNPNFALSTKLKVPATPEEILLNLN